MHTDIQSIVLVYSYIFVIYGILSGITIFKMC